MKLFTAWFHKKERGGLEKEWMKVQKNTAEGTNALPETRALGKAQGVILDYKLAEESHRLIFASRWKVPGGLAVDKANTVYQLGGRTYTGIKTACEYTEEEISDGVLIGKDEFGGKILYEYSSIPVFDFGDRQWDSLAGSFLIFDGTNIDLLQFRRGYCVAEIVVYENLLEADKEMKPWLERLEFPTGEIKWN